METTNHDEDIPIKHTDQGVCPVTGMRIYEKPGWRYRTDDDHYRGRLFMVGRQIMVWQPEGTPREEDAERITELIYDAIDEIFPNGERFYAIFDYSGLRNPPIANRLRVLSNLRETVQRLQRVIFFGMNRSVRTIVRLSVRISGLSEKIFIKSDYREAMQQVLSLIKDEGQEPDFTVYQPEEVQNLLEIISEIVWNRAYSVQVPELDPLHPLSELYNAVDVMRRDLKMLDEENRRKQQELAEANRVKDDFIANMSHEIRTPLGGILGGIELLQKTGPTAEQSRYLRLIEQSSGLLMDRVNEVLDFSKLQHRVFSLDRRICDIGQVCRETVEMSLPRSQKKGIELLSYIDPEIPRRGISDPLRLRQILMNLLSNAIKFTDAGLVHLDCRLVARDEESFHCRFQVRDTGIGISPQQQEKIFQKFVRLESAPHRRQEGSGLGLSIVRELLELFGSDLEVESRLNGGSVFSFSLAFPLAEKPPEDEAAEEETGRQESKAPRRFYGRVLVADDDEVNRLVISDMLTSYGCTVVPVAGGAEALEILSHQRVDLVLLDLWMPEIDGYHVVKKIRARDDAVGDVPVIAVSAYSEEEQDMDPSGTLFDGRINKPLSGRKLEEIMDSFLPPDLSTEIEEASGTLPTPPPDVSEYREPAPSSTVESAGSRRIETLLLKRLRGTDEETQGLEALIEAGKTEAAAELVHRLRGLLGHFEALPIGRNSLRVAGILERDLREGEAQRSRLHLHYLKELLPLLRKREEELHEEGREVRKP
jgi:signal transduction histidine kinase/CheY-like chemotaxis protein